MEAFNREAQDSQDWNMRGLDYNGGASELSMLVGSSGGKRAVEESEPKLEDFLGGNSFVSEQDQGGGFLFSGVPMVSSTNSNSGSHTMELSMIKTWLRNNQQPHADQLPRQQQAHEAADMSTDASASSFAGCSSDATGRNVVAAAGSSQSLALSMSTGSHLPVVVACSGSGVSGGATESTSSENKRASGAMDSPGGGAIEAVPRKSIDTFGAKGPRYIEISTYEKEIDEMKHMTRQEYIAYLRSMVDMRIKSAHNNYEPN
ncbi:hypothetical protein ABZP36_033250 [Zizania latifolia]